MNIIYALYDTHSMVSKSYSDQAGRFPIRYSQGNQYIFIFYNFDNNSIHALPLKNINRQRIIYVWSTIFLTLKKPGKAPNLHLLNNECSYELKKIFEN